MSCPSPCCYCLFRHSEHKQAKQKYPHIVYRHPDSANTNVETPPSSKSSAAPCPDKIFEFSQSTTEYPVHPQIRPPSRAKYGQSGTDVVQCQPSITSEQKSESTLAYNQRENSTNSLPSCGLESEGHHGSVDRRVASSAPPGRPRSGSLSVPLKKLHYRSRSMGESGMLAWQKPKIPRRGSYFQDENPPPIVQSRKSSVVSLGGVDLSNTWVPDLPVIEQSDLPESQDSLPLLQFSLYYDVHRRILTVNLQEATNLPAKNRKGTSDPFVVIHLDPNKEEILESEIVFKTLNPQWNQTFDFANQSPDEIRRQTIVLRVYDNDKSSKNDFIGAVLLPLADADLYGMPVRMIIDETASDFRLESKGDLLLSLNYIPERGVIQGVLLKATNLQKQDIAGLADPYVKIYLLYKGKRRFKWKSSIKKNTLVPIFNEQFRFDISRLDVKEIVLHAVVMDYDRFTKNDYVGTVLIGENVEQESGREHWAHMMSSARHPVSQWHPISPAPFCPSVSY